MTNNNVQTQAPGTGVTVNVSSHLIGRSLIDDLRRSVSISDQEDLGDDFMDQSRELLEKHMSLMELRTQQLVRETVMK